MRALDLLGHLVFFGESATQRLKRIFLLLGGHEYHFLLSEEVFVHDFATLARAQGQEVVGDPLNQLSEVVEVVSERNLFLGQFEDVLPEPVHEVEVGQCDDDALDSLQVAALFADQLRVLAVVLEHLVVVAVAALLRVVQHHSVNVARVQDVSGRVCEVAVLLARPSIELLLLALNHLLVVVEFDRVDKHGTPLSNLATSAQIRVHGEVNGLRILEALGPAGLPVALQLQIGDVALVVTLNAVDGARELQMAVCTNRNVSIQSAR